MVGYRGVGYMGGLTSLCMIYQQQNLKVVILWLRERIPPQKIPQATGMPKIAKLELGDHFGKHGFFF